MITHNLNQPADVAWILRDKTNSIAMTKPTSKRQFESLSNAVLFVKEELPENVVAWVTAGKGLVTPEQVSTIYGSMTPDAMTPQDN